MTGTNVDTGHADHVTRQIRWLAGGSVLAAITWLVLWVVEVPAKASGFDFGACGSVADPQLGPCRAALEQRAMFAGLSLGVAVFLAVMALIYRATRSPFRDHPHAVHWVLAGFAGILVMSAWLAIALSGIDYTFS